MAVWEELKVSIPQADVHQWANRLIEYIDTITLDLAKERFYGLVNQGFPPAQAFDIIVESAK